MTLLRILSVGFDGNNTINYSKNNSLQVLKQKNSYCVCYRNMSYLTLLKSFVFVHRKSKMATAAGQIKKCNSSQKLDI